MHESLGDYLKRTWMLGAICITAMLGGESNNKWIAWPMCFASGVFISLASKRLTK